jgi:hypothetical protein
VFGIPSVAVPRGCYAPTDCSSQVSAFRKHRNGRGPWDYSVVGPAADVGLLRRGRKVLKQGIAVLCWSVETFGGGVLLRMRCWATLACCRHRPISSRDSVMLDYRASGEESHATLDLSSYWGR